ncbi:MAG TPA: N-acetylglucosamine-6-phosphate deacetylase [Pyrinomonadaceae bacterium]|jgi:N-acetylglucosamine-6-phosphate deacetylase|nr:N-acetylglucosamine-6-phosphate deacetylase [Pyrinomonadaceae bacterium]
MENSPTADEKLLLRNARVVLPHAVAESASLLVEGGRIARLSQYRGPAEPSGAREIDLSGLTVYPGFVDVHIHGSVGIDLMEADAESLHRVARFLAASGVTTWVPTLVPGPVEEYRRAVGAVEELMRTQDSLAPAARAAGVHYEGPFVNERQCGALRTEFFRAFDDASKLDELPTLAAEGAAHLMTLAPEVEGGVNLIKELVARGWVASIGHTRAGLETLEAALGAGARHMTHFLNAMSPLHHREPGPIGWGLVRDDVTVDLIADGVHSDPLMLRLVLRCKTPARVSLISDAVAPAGLGDGDYRLWGETIRVREGRTSNERGSIAGSVITMLDAARMARSLGLPETDVARVASYNPARLLRLEDRGSIEEGKRADLTALDDSGRVRLTLVGGRVAHREG